MTDFVNHLVSLVTPRAATASLQDLPNLWIESDSTSSQFQRGLLLRTCLLGIEASPLLRANRKRDNKASAHLKALLAADLEKPTVEDIETLAVLLEYSATDCLRAAQNRSDQDAVRDLFIATASMSILLSGPLPGLLATSATIHDAARSARQNRERRGGSLGGAYRAEPSENDVFAEKLTEIQAFVDEWARLRTSQSHGSQGQLIKAIKRKFGLAASDGALRQKLGRHKIRIPRRASKLHQD